MPTRKIKRKKTNSTRKGSAEPEPEPVAAARENLMTTLHKYGVPPQILDDPSALVEVAGNKINTELEETTMAAAAAAQAVATNPKTQKALTDAGQAAATIGMEVGKAALQTTVEAAKGAAPAAVAAATGAAKFAGATVLDIGEGVVEEIPGVGPVAVTALRELYALIQALGTIFSALIMGFGGFVRTATKAGEVASRAAGPVINAGEKLVDASEDVIAIASNAANKATSKASKTSSKPSRRRGRKKSRGGVRRAQRRRTRKRRRRMRRGGDVPCRDTKCELGEGRHQLCEQKCGEGATCVSDLKGSKTHGTCQPMYPPDLERPRRPASEKGKEGPPGRIELARAVAEPGQGGGRKRR